MLLSPTALEAVWRHSLSKAITLMHYRCQRMDFPLTYALQDYREPGYHIPPPPLDPVAGRRRGTLGTKQTRLKLLYPCCPQNRLLLELDGCFLKPPESRTLQVRPSGAPNWWMKYICYFSRRLNLLSKPFIVESKKIPKVLLHLLLISVLCFAVRQ